MRTEMIPTLRPSPDQEMGILSPETLKKRRELAQRLLEGATDTSPVGHWTQGAARMAQALHGAVADWATDKEEKRGQEAGRAIEGQLLAALGGGGGGQSPPPNVMTSPSPAPDAMIAPSQSPQSPQNPPNSQSSSPKMQYQQQVEQLSGIDNRYLPDEAVRELALWNENGRPDTLTGLNPQKAVRLAAFLEDNPYENSIGINSGYRSTETQQQLFDNAVAKYGSVAAARKWVAPPGRSQHNHGNAVDLGFDDPRAQEWAHANADRYGLAFPMAHEPWHVELANARSGGSPAPRQVAALGGGGSPPHQPPMPPVRPQNIGATQSAPESPDAVGYPPSSPQGMGIPSAGGQSTAPPPVQVAQAEPNRMSLAQLMALKNSPGFAYAPKGTQSIVDALIQREVTQQAKDPRDGMVKDLTIQKMRNELANSGLTRRQQELAIRKAEKDLEDKPNVEIIRDAATGEIIAVDKNDINSGVKKLREAGPSKDAPVTKQIKQPDGSEVAVQWDAQTRAWVPLRAPEGGASIRAPGKLTEQQSKDLVYYNRGLQAMETFGEGAGLTGAEGLAGATVGQIPVVGNYAKSKEFQMAEQSGQNYLASILRKDSGAAITANEQKIYGEVFLPRPGDDPATIKQKAEARKQAIDAIRDGLGPAEVLALGQRLTRREDAKVPTPDVPTKRPPEKDPLGLFQ